MSTSPKVERTPPGLHTLPAAARAGRPARRWIGLVAALLVAAQLRVTQLLENRFHPDEAHYAAFARFIASGPGHGILLSHMVVDKPPLSFYVNAVSVAVFGASEFAVRLPNLLFSIVSVALVYALARRLYNAPAAHAAMWAMTLSPFAIQFAITAFVDPLLTALLLGGLWLMVNGRSGWAALALGLAFATKQTALLFIPLALALGLLTLPPPVRFRQAAAYLLRALVQVLAALTLTLLLLLAWDYRRGAPISFWRQGYIDNMPGGPARLVELMPRADALLSLLHYFTGSALINGIFLAGLLVLLVVDVRRVSRAAWVDGLLAVYQLAYLGVYWLLPFNLWDRYLLPILPLALLLFGRVAELAYRGLQRVVDGLGRMAGQGQAGSARLALFTGGIALPVAVLAVVVPNTFATNYAFSPIGGDHGSFDGIDETAHFVRTLPRNGVLYDHWLSWEFEYYLFDQPLTITWFPDAKALTADLADSGRALPRYLAVPWWASAADTRAAVVRAGFTLSPIHQSFRRDGAVSIVIYRIRPKP